MRYDPESGDFYWLGGRIKSNGRVSSYKERKAGCPDKNGTCKYVGIRINNFLYDAHRLAFLYMTGKFPQGVVDHIDGNGLNNRWSNLRDVEKSYNSRNRHRHERKSSTGETGIYYSKDGKRFQVKIDINRKRFTVGIFETIEEAILMRSLCRIEVGLDPETGQYVSKQKD